MSKEEPTKKQIADLKEIGYEWDSEKKAFLDLEFNEYLSFEQVEYAYLDRQVLVDKKDEFSSGWTLTQLRTIGGWDITSLDELERIDEAIKWQKENG